MSRNNTVDIIRGFAMLLVVLGHTMSGCTANFQDSLLFQVIWTLQMPLFIIISGYVTRYSRSLLNGGALWSFVKKRSLAYLFPWAIWTFFIRVLVFGETGNFNIKFLLWHMDCGYWFLITIWTISMIFGLSDLLSNKIAKDKSCKNIFLHFALCCVGMVGLAAIGYVLGLSFFCIKLTLYYLPIYLIGYLYGQVQDNLIAKTYSKALVNVTIAVCLGLWLAIINRFDFFGGADTPVMIAFRFCTSIFGCTAIIGIFTSLFNGGGISHMLNWVGVHSLEVYLSHYLLLNLFHMEQLQVLMTLNGITLMTVNFLTTVGLTSLLIIIVQHNPVLNYLLYAKRSLGSTDFVRG